LVALVGIVGIGGTAAYKVTRPKPAATAGTSAKVSFYGDADASEDPPEPTGPVPVEVILPKKGAMARQTTQPGSVHAFESVDLYAKIPGFLKIQKVDIGDRIKRGEVLAVVDVPEQEKQVQRDRAAVAQTDALVLQTQARVATAKANLDAAGAEVKQAQANAKSAAAWVRFRALQLQRMRDLFATKSVEERLVDEAKERYEASVETEQAAEAAIITTKAKVAAAIAKIQQAEADVAEAKSEVQVAQANLEKAQVLLDYATIRAPFDGVVTYRSMFVGDFVRAANESGSKALLTVQRTDLMRVVVQVPDRDALYADPGDPATLEFDTLPGKKFQAKISRIAQSQDPQTRLMRVEIDLPNTSGKIRDGMYAKATILLDNSSDKYSIPTTCIVNKSEERETGTVFVVKDGKAHPVTVSLGEDNGLRVEILKGLSAGDQVVLHPGNSLEDGAAVTATLVKDK
jgi:HlyD family secretion protein